MADNNVAIKPRKAFLAQMNEATRAIAVELEEKFGKAAIGVVRIQWEIGETTKRVLGDESTYGQDAVKTIAGYLGVDPTTLYNAMQVHETFELADIIELTAVPMSNGRFLSFNHFVVLSRVTDAKKRTKLVKRTLDESLSTHDLEIEIRSVSEGPQRGNVGRKPKVPKTPIAGLQRTLQLAVKLERWVPTMEKHVCNVLDDLGSGDVTSVLVTKTETTLEAVRRLHEHTAKMLQRLEENAVHLQKMQSADDTGTPKPEETPKTAKKKDKKNKKVKPKKGKAKPPVAAV